LHRPEAGKSFQEEIFIREQQDFIGVIGQRRSKIPVADDRSRAESTMLSARRAQLDANRFVSASP
jgi:hypothetical protein